MRTLSLSSRLQWAFRGTVLQGALATGDVDNDGCNEFVVGSVQGELAVFRGRGGCGSWKHSEGQVEPEYDCWDAVMRGEDPPGPAASRTEIGSLRRPSTNNSNSYGMTSNRESMSVDDILHMIDGGERAAISEAGDPRRPSLTEGDAADQEGHVKWEDVLDIERDGRKPWILAQNLGTISSVVVADISNSGHNSIVVVNGEGKCHVFDYPFRRRFHPDLAKRRRQQNHMRRFSQDRFFKDGIVSDAHGEDHAQASIQQFPTRPDDPAAAGAPAAHGSNFESPPPQLQRDTGPPAMGQGQNQALRVRSALSSALADAAAHSVSCHPDRGSGMSGGGQSEPKLSQHSGTATFQRIVARDIGPSSPAGAAGSSKPLSASAHSGHEFALPRGTWRPLSGVDGQMHDASAGLAQGYSMAPTSNVSSQADPPLTMIDTRTRRTTGPTPQADGSALPDLSRMPTSPLDSQAHHGSRHGGFSTDTGNSSHRHAAPATAAATDVSMEASGAVFGDAFVESDMDSTDETSDSGEAAWLTPEEVADIEKIWGADVGKRSGDWFPYVLDRPDATFDIPTNVEHALVADIDNNGLNELVLTSTDGFVYIFRIGPTVKHVVRAALTPLGAFSSIPTAMPSVNMTAAGSPYLYMSAPRSPDASDLELDDSGKTPSAAAAVSTTIDAVHGSISQGGRMHSTASEPLLRAAGQRTPPPPTPALPAVAEVPSETAAAASSPSLVSGVNLVNQLLRSLRDAPPVPGNPSSSSSSHGAPGSSVSHVRGTAVTAPPTPTQPPQTTDKRASLTSRMRESFSYIVSGPEAPSKPKSMFNRTAPPSLSHSQVHTANNSGSSTNAHSRRPSSIHGAIDPGLLDQSLDGLAAEREAHKLALRAPSIVEATPVVVISETQSTRRRGRPRHNTVCADYHGPMPAGGGLPQILEILSGPGSLRPLSTSASTQDRSLAACADQNTGQIPRRTSGSLARSRRSSGSSAVARLRALSGGTSDMDLEAVAEDVADTTSRTSSSTSSSSSSSSSSHASDSSDSDAGGGASRIAVPSNAAVCATGSFTRPRGSYKSAATHIEPSEDRASLISQVTERLEGLDYRSTEQRAAGLAERTNTTPAEARAKRNSTYTELLASEMGVQLPPARSVVDWSFTTADEVATWFLDNIPGGVSMVSAPVDAFGEPLASQRQIAYTDDSSLSSCSTSCCSQCDSDGDESISSESANDRAQGVYAPRPPGTAIAPVSKSMVTHPRPESGTSFRYGVLARSMAVPGTGLAAGHSGLTLPQPLELATIGAEVGGYTTGAGATSCPVQDRGSAKLDNEPTSPSIPSSGEAEGGDTDGAQASRKAGQRTWPQQFLILSKPGGRFVPIDMNRGVILPTVEPPGLPVDALTGGNTAHLMNVDASGSQHSFHMARGSGGALPHYSATDLTTDSYMGQSPSWQSSSVPWVHTIPGMSFSSAGALAVSPAQMGDADMAKLAADRHQYLAPEAPTVSQFPVAHAQPGGGGGGGSPAPLLVGEAAAANADADMRRLPTGASYSSVVRPGSVSGAASLSSNLRAQRSLHRTSYDVLRTQGPTAHFGPNPVNRGIATSGMMTPATGPYLVGASQIDRRQLGYAGLRGYIGGNSRQGMGGRSSASLRADDGRFQSSYYSPQGTGPLTGRGYGFAISQGLGTGAMPREPSPGYFSPVPPSATSAASGERHTRFWLDNIRGSPHQPRHGPVPPASVSPQPGQPQQQQQQQQSRYSPSLAGWASFKSGGIMGAVRDRDDAPEVRDHRRPNSATPAYMAPSEHHSGTHLPDHLGSEPEAGGFGDGVPVTAAERAFWSHAEFPSARSHSSLGTGASAGLAPLVAKEEEIEEAPQPMELEVATYMVGGVSPGLWRAGRRPPASAGDACGSDSEDEAGELVSLVTMDGTISCYDPRRKVNHYVTLNPKDPVLGIWKTKMHREVCQPSPLAEALRDGHVAADTPFGRWLVAHTPATLTRRRVGLSHRSLLDAVRFATYVEDSVHLLNGLDSGFRRRSQHTAAAMRRLRQASYGVLDERTAQVGQRRMSPRGSRGHTLARLARVGLNSRLLDTINWSRQAPRATTRGPPARAGTEDEGSYRGPSDTDAANASFSSAARKPSAGRLAAGEPTTREGARAKGDDGDADGMAPAPSGTGSASNPGTGPALSQADAAQIQRAINKDLAAALMGWYGRTNGSVRPNPHASDHLIVSTWRGTTYFIDVGTLMDVAHYHRQFKERWNASAAVAAESAFAAASSEKDSSSMVDAQNVAMSLVYSNIGEFSDITGLISRLRVNASVIQFKFQDTVSAFLADTYAPATGGPNIPCLFYVDYKNRIWAYYHLDGIAEMDDVYGATWLDGEQERLHATDPKAGPGPGLEAPFTVVDLAYRRMNMDPWTPLPEDKLFRTLVACSDTTYPYSAKLWRRPAAGSKAPGAAAESASGRPCAALADEVHDARERGHRFGGRESEPSGAASDNSTPMFLRKANANVTGSYHSSFLPGPYLCPVWADINSVDLYDLGTSNLLELAMPELLAAKHAFCAALGINPDSVDERTNLATIPGLANWVRGHLSFL